ncbi:MAG: AraC family transcriptional regulator [Oscillospiraceae bacterium]|nr:AraC family transcriptional regulator [Oscillospiraceae bacterium]
MWTYNFSDTPPQDEGPVLQFIEFSRSIYGHSRPYHAHEEYHILFCTKGRAYLRLGEIELDITPGMIALIPPGVLHSIGPRQEGLEFWGISFSPSGPEDEIVRFQRSCNAYTADFSGFRDYVEGAFLFIHETANRARETGDPHREELAEQIIRSQTSVLVYFALSMFSTHPYRHPLPREGSMDKVMRWIMEHYAENITLDALAERFALSPSHLSRKFQEAFQVSPINYLIDYRISMAKDLLIHTDKPIAQVAEEVGYANPYHFSSLFSRRTGLTPQQMRSVCRQSTTQPEEVIFPGEEKSDPA